MINTNKFFIEGVIRRLEKAQCSISGNNTRLLTLVDYHEAIESLREELGDLISDLEGVAKSGK